MLVTGIEQQKRHPHRMNVYLDDEFAFGLHRDVLVTFGLKKGDRLDRETIDRILSKEEIVLAKSCALHSLNRRLRSEKELRDKLSEKEFTPSTIDAVMAHLRDIGLINDTEFTKAFVHDAQMHKPLGKRLLRQKLRQKGIPVTVIDPILHEKVSEKDEESLALQEAKKIVRRYASSRKVTEEQKQRQRVARHLVRRGFSWDTIVPVVKQIFAGLASRNSSQ